MQYVLVVCMSACVPGKCQLSYSLLTLRSPTLNTLLSCLSFHRSDAMNTFHACPSSNHQWSKLPRVVVETTLLVVMGVVVIIAKNQRRRIKKQKDVPNWRGAGRWCNNIQKQQYRIHPHHMHIIHIPSYVTRHDYYHGIHVMSSKGELWGGKQLHVHWELSIRIWW